MRKTAFHFSQRALVPQSFRAVSGSPIEESMQKSSAANARRFERPQRQEGAKADPAQPRLWRLSTLSAVPFLAFAGRSRNKPGGQNLGDAYAPQAANSDKDYMLLGAGQQGRTHPLNVKKTDCSQYVTAKAPPSRFSLLRQRSLAFFDFAGLVAENRLPLFRDAA